MEATLVVVGAVAVTSYVVGRLHEYNNPSERRPDRETVVINTPNGQITREYLGRK